MAAAARPSRRRVVWLVLAAAAAIALVGLAFLLGAILTRPQQAGAQPTPATAPAAASPSPSGSPAPETSQQQHQQYRAYVATALSGSASVVASMGGLEVCRSDRAKCLANLQQASAEVDNFEKKLAANPAPPCLSEADQRLQDALTFWNRGLSAAHDAVKSQNRVQLAQGLLLTTAGTVRAGQALISIHQSDC